MIEAEGPRMVKRPGPSGMVANVALVSSVRKHGSERVQLSVRRVEVGFMALDPILWITYLPNIERLGTRSGKDRAG